MSGWENVRELFNDAIDLVIASLFLAIGLAGLGPGVQRSWSYFAAGIALGTILGLAARRFGVPAGVDIMVMVLGVVTGPVTVVKLQGKTFLEAFDEIISFRERMKGGDDEGAS